MCAIFRHGLLAGLWAVWMMLSWSVHAAPLKSDLSVERQTLLNEIRFQPADRVELTASERCPSWLTLSAEGLCRRLNVVYRDAYLSGILVQHDRTTRALTVYHVGHESTPQSTDDANSRSTAPLADQSDQLVNLDATTFISSLYDQGADVLILFMPGLGLHPPAWASDKVKRVHRIMSDHNSFALLDYPGDSAATYFLAHLEAFMNDYGKRYSQVRMIGRSGGGWATTLAAALDERIQCSISFFGSLPLRLRLPQPEDGRTELGDYEQYGLYLLKRTNYLDLYALGTTATRTHVEVYNEKDDCCFSGATKGIRVRELFGERYPNTKRFSVVILPYRTAKDHGNLDDSALSVVQSYCPVR